METELDDELKAAEGVFDMVSEFKKINADAEKRQLMEAREKNRDALKIIKGDSFTRGHKKGKIEGKAEVAMKMHAAELQKLFFRS